MAAHSLGGFLISVKRLHASEFDLLKTIDDGFVPDPERSIAVVAENDQKIIGRIFLVSPMHVEGIYIEKPWRNGPLMKSLVQAIELEAKCEKISQVLVFAKDEEMADYIARLGYRKTPYSVWTKELDPCL